MNNTLEMNKQQILIKIIKEFMLMWLLTGVGMIIGSFLPPVLAMCMSILALVLLIITLFVKGTKTKSKIFYVIPFLMGFAFYFSINFYLAELGAGMVLGILVLTVVMFLGLGFLGYVAIKRNLSFMGKLLLFALLALIIVSIIGLFFSTYMFQLLLAVAGIFIFSLYVVYDFNEIQHNHITNEETTGYALNLYLDFINFFLNLLRLAYLLFNED